MPVKYICTKVGARQKVIIICKNVSLDIPKNKIIDVGPDGGTKGGEIVFTGTPKEMYEKADTITAKYLRKSIEKIKLY